MNLHSTENPIIVSLCTSAAATACTNANPLDLLQKIRAGEWAGRVAQLRSAFAASGKDAANAIKRTLPGVTWSGLFTVRRKSGFVRHSGLIAVDIDHVADPAALRNQLAADPHCVGAFISPSGHGVKALFPVDPAKPHAESWRALGAYCKAAFAVEIDPACKDVSRLCFISHDPEAYVAPGEIACIPYPTPSPEPAAPASSSATEVNAGGLLSTGDDFNARGDVAPLLREHGWASTDDEEWTRPGKESGVSATLGRLDDLPRALFVFSPNAPPFEANKTYQPFAVFAMLKHGGDFNAAAAELRGMGYGTPDEDAGPLYFDGQSYWRLERDGRFGRLGRADAQLHLKMSGHSTRAPKGVDRSPNEIALFAIQRSNRVTYAAPFCGRPAGLYQENGHAILATDSPTIIPAADGSLDALENFFRNLFGEGQDVHAGTQFDVFVGWLQRLRRALANPAQHLPGQALFLVGPASCGKTLAQNLITHLAGGRSADPSGWIFKNSDFNDGLWGAELLNLSDANVEDVAGARRKLRDRLKQLVANDLAPCHRKHRGEISLRPIWRVTVSANPDADSATVIPNLDESVADKVIYLKCYLPPEPFPTATEEGASNFYKSLIGAAPAFLNAAEGFELPPELRGVRFGVREWHHPAIVEMTEGVHPDADLSDLIDDFLSTLTEDSISGPATELFKRLDAFHYPMFGKTCRSPQALSQALRRLSHVARWESRISSERVGPNKQTAWTVRKTTLAEAA